MRRLLARKAPARVEDSEPAPIELPATQTESANTTYPTYGEVYASDVRKDRETHSLASSFKFAARRERNMARDGLIMMNEGSRHLRARDAPLRRSGTWSQGHRPSDLSTATHTDDATSSPYPVYHPRAAEAPSGERQRQRDRSSGLFKWKRTHNASDPPRPQPEDRREKEPSDSQQLSMEISMCLYSHRYVLPRPSTSR